MRVSTSEESTFNKLAEIETELYRLFNRADRANQLGLLAHLKASIIQIQISKAAALEAAGKELYHGNS